MVIPAPTAFAATLHWTLAALAMWSTLSSLEAVASRGAFAAGQPLGVDLAALVRGRLQPALLRSPLATPHGLLAAAVLRLVVGLALPLLGGGSAMGALLVVAGCTVVLTQATGGSDGADKIALVACAAAALIAAGRWRGDALLCLAGTAWGAGQLAIAYATSGIAKLGQRFWRDGSAVAATMTSFSSGHRTAAAVVRHRPLALTLAWGVMLVEAVFPLALLAPPPVCIAALSAMMALHVATAVVMGLNTYPWAFLATYPCAAMANGMIAAAIGGMAGPA